MGRLRANYKALWDQDRLYYGKQDQAAPLFQVGRVQGADGSTSTGEAGQRRVTLAPSTSKFLAQRQPNLSARNTVAHEWAHEFQDPFIESRPKLAELGARRLAKAISRNNPQKRARAYNNLGNFAKSGQFATPPNAQAIHKALRAG